MFHSDIPTFWSHVFLVISLQEIPQQFFASKGPPGLLSFKIGLLNSMKRLRGSMGVGVGSCSLRFITRGKGTGLRFHELLSLPRKMKVFYNQLFPESVWAQGSSNSGGLYLIFSSSHLLTFTSSSHLLIFTSSHLHIISSSHLLIFTSWSHLLIFTPSHPHIFSSSHLLIFTSSHLHIFSWSSHLHILTTSHLLIFKSSHIYIFLSSHLHIFTSSHLHICSSSHLHICSSSHLLILTSSHLHILTSSHFLLLPSCLLPSCLHIFTSSPLAHSFARNEVRSPKTAVKLRFQLVRRNPSTRKEVRSIAKNCGKIAICKSSRATLLHEMRFDRQKMR